MFSNQHTVQKVLYKMKMFEQQVGQNVLSLLGKMFYQHIRQHVLISDMKEQVVFSLSLCVCVYMRKVFSPQCEVYMPGCIDTFILPLSDEWEGAKQLLCFVF